jgi:hypothetical protein
MHYFKKYMHIEVQSRTGISNRPEDSQAEGRRSPVCGTRGA